MALQFEDVYVITCAQFETVRFKEVCVITYISAIQIIKTFLHMHLFNFYCSVFRLLWFCL